jgi:hypothetical protein
MQQRHNNQGEEIVAYSKQTPFSGHPLFPSASLRQRLQSLGIGLVYHERASLHAMLERGTGARCSEDRTPDELAEALIQLEQTSPQYV